MKTSGFSWRLSASTGGRGQLVALGEEDGVARARGHRRRGHRVLGALAARDDHVVGGLARRDRVEAVDLGRELVDVLAVDRRRSCSRPARAASSRSGSPARPSSGRSPSGRAGRACPRDTAGRSSPSESRSGAPIARAGEHRRGHAALPVVLVHEHDGLRAGGVAGRGPDRARDAGDVGDRVAAAHAGRVLGRREGEARGRAAASSSSAFTPIWGGASLVVVADRTARKERATVRAEAPGDEPPRLTLARRLRGAVAVRLTGQSTKGFACGFPPHRRADRVPAALPQVLDRRHPARRRQVRPRAVGAVGRDQGGAEVGPPRARLHPEDRQRPGRPVRRDLRRGAALGLRRASRSPSRPRRSPPRASRPPARPSRSASGCPSATALGDEIKLGAYAVTEAGAGSDVKSLRTTAKLDGDEWVLNGTKVFISNGGIADVTVVVATVDPELGHRGQASFVVPEGHARPLAGQEGGQDRHPRLADRRGRPRGLPDPGRLPARRHGQAREEARARALGAVDRPRLGRARDVRDHAPARRRLGARHRAGRVRVDARVPRGPHRSRASRRSRCSACSR